MKNTTVQASMLLPMTAVFTVQRASERFIARALDFDLVAVATSEERALENLRLAVKTHIEYGVKNGLGAEDIQRKSPDEHWNILTPDSPICIGETIEIEGCKMRTHVVKAQSNEPERRHIAA